MDKQSIIEQLIIPGIILAAIFTSIAWVRIRERRRMRGGFPRTRRTKFERWIGRFM
jgi:hypothetical protein